MQQKAKKSDLYGSKYVFLFAFSTQHFVSYAFSFAKIVAKPRHVYLTTANKPTHSDVIRILRSIRPDQYLQ